MKVLEEPWWSMSMTFSSSAAEMPWWNSLCLHFSRSMQSPLNSCRSPEMKLPFSSAPMNCWKMAGWLFECITSTSISCANSCAFPKGFRARRPQVTARWRFQTSLQSSIPMMLRCTALAWGFFCTCQLTCHSAIMWFDTYPLSLQSRLRNPLWCWNTWLATWQHTPNSACLWNGKVCMLVFSNSMRTRSRWWKFSAMLTGQLTERQDALSRELQFTLVAVSLIQAPGHRRSCHFRAQSQKHMQLRRPPWMRSWSQPSFHGFSDVISWCVCIWIHQQQEVFFLEGVGRLRHLSCRILWMQDLVMEKRLLVRSVMGALNPADIATKRLSAARLESLCYFLGMWRGTRKQSGGSTWPRKHLQAAGFDWLHLPGLSPWGTLEKF